MHPERGDPCGPTGLDAPTLFVDLIRVDLHAPAPGIHTGSTTLSNPTRQPCSSADAYEAKAAAPPYVGTLRSRTAARCVV